MRATKRNHTALRLVAGLDVEEQRDRCNESNFSAASPRGEPVRPHSMSLTDEAAKPTRPPISVSVRPVDLRSDIREAHVVMESNIRNPEVICQRKADTVFRNNVPMPRPKEMPADLLTVGSRVRWWRKHRKLSQGELAKAAKIAPSTLSDLENDRQDGTGKLHLVTAALRLNAHYVETGKGEPEAEFAQEPPTEAPAWPFGGIPPSRLAKLNLIERSYAENKLQEALAEIEAERRKSRKTG